MIEDAYNNMMQAGAMGQTALDNHIMRQQQAAQIAMMNGSALQNRGVIYGGGSGGSLGSVYDSAQQALPSQPIYILPTTNIMKDPNSIASMCMPLTALVDLWRVKWGDTWLYDRALPPVEDLDLWTMAAVRLHASNKFEIVSQYFRLREDA